ncbi:ABC transporter substrate-binding protein [Bacillus sp. SM2101]|uniref:ABC transporter substrate-binding protein n=1 Tax=Bacillus sp. SM2101 TaxID=2805366 RepID=UPI001BDDE58A|nr:ABC transporter substrate-binding protein [Bacillus sp. SM2101]
MKRKNLFMTFIFILMLSLVVAACGKSEDTSSGEDVEETEQEQTEEEATEPEEEAKPKELVFGRGGDSVDLDPAIVTDGESMKVAKNIYDTLVEYGDQDTTIHKSLAEDWEISDDGLVYTFKLQQGVKFHDGTDFNADAVVYNFERWANGSKDSFYYYGSMFGGFAGEEGHVISEVVAEDEYTVKFTLTVPQSPFLKNLAMTPFSIASPSAIEEFGDNFTENPVGTGPFVFKEWKRDERIVLEKNTDYWLANYPLLDKVTFLAIPDNAARFNALQSGEIDLMDGINPSDVDLAANNGDLQVFERPSMNVGYLGLTSTRGPLQEKLVRQALNHAVDKEALIGAFYAGQAEPAKNPMPPSISGYNDDIEDYPYDLDRAKELLAEAGYPDGFEMELWAMPVPRPYMPEGQKVAEVLQAEFAKIGVKAEIVTFDWGTYLDKARLGEADTFLLGWTGDNGDADNFLNVLLSGGSIGSNNYSYYDNAEVNELLKEAQTTADEDTRNDLYKQAQEIIKDDAPWIPLVHSKPMLAGKENITGFLPHPTGSDKLTKVDFK